MGRPGRWSTAMRPGFACNSSFSPPGEPARWHRSKRLELHRVRQKIPQRFARRKDVSRERGVLILKQGDNFENQEIVALAKLRERRAAAPVVECAEPLEQIVDLVL